MDESEAKTTELVIPFEDKSKDFFTGLLETLKLVLFQPTTFFRNYKLDNPIGRSLLFAVIIGWFAAIVDIIWGMVINRSMFTYFKENFSKFEEYFPELEGFDFSQFESVGAWESLQSIIGIIIAPFMVLLFVFIFAGLFHLFLMMVKGANKNFETTINIVAYGMAASIFKVLPFCGQLVYYVYWVILSIIGLTETHKTDSWKAVFAVIAPFLLCCLCCVMVVFLIVSTGILATQ
jgi:hypothetical protein